MKVYLIFAVAFIASAVSEEVTPEPKPLEIEWQAKYGQYGVEGILPIQYNVPSASYRRYNLPLYQYQYPIPTQYQLPAGYQIPFPYQIPQYSVPYPQQVAVKGPGRVVTSFDPDYFASNYGFYPEKK